MKIADSRASVPNLATVLAIVFIGAGLSACETYAGKGAAQGAGTGAIAGAVGGAVTALVFGGDPVEAAARSAVWGASAGAATGAIAGSQADKKVEQQTQKETEAKLAKLREEIGDENFAGLESLADCRHDESLRAAAKGRQSNNPNYALAGLWLEILNYADSGREAKARELFPTLVKQDWNIETAAQAENSMREGVTALGNVRAEFDMPRVCAT